MSGTILPMDDRYIVRHSSVQGYELYDRVERKVLFYSGDRTMVMDEALKENRKAMIDRRDLLRATSERLYAQGKADEAFPVAKEYHAVCKIVGYPADVV